MIRILHRPWFTTSMMIFAHLQAIPTPPLQLSLTFLMKKQKTLKIPTTQYLFCQQNNYFSSVREWMARNKWWRQHWDIADEEKCCMCRDWKPKELQNYTSVVYVKCGKCVFCDHWTPVLYFCSSIEEGIHFYNVGVPIVKTNEKNE